MTQTTLQALTSSDSPDTHTLAAFDASTCDDLGRVLHPLEPDWSVECRHFPNWYNWAYNCPRRMQKSVTGAGLQVVEDRSISAQPGDPASRVLEWPDNNPCLLLGGWKRDTLGEHWSNVTVSAELRMVEPHANAYPHDLSTLDQVGRCGLAVRALDVRRHYMAVIEEGHRLVIARRENDNLVRLNDAPFDAHLRRYYRMELRCVEDRFDLYIDGELRLTAFDDAWRCGRAGLVTNTVTRWRSALVSCSIVESRAIEVRGAEHEADRRAAAGRVPQAKSLATFDLPIDDAAYRGVLDTEAGHLLFSYADAEAGHTLLASDRAGHEVWRRAFDPSARHIHLTLADVDLDGAVEVLLLTGHEIHVIDGRTGQSRACIPYPEGSPFIHMRGERATQLKPASVGAFHLAGRDKPARICIFEYTGAGAHTVWCYDHKLNHRWTHHNYHGKIGHVLRALDIDGDGRDELIVPYYALDDDMNELWRLRDADRVHKQEHADNWYAGPFGADGALRVIAACGEAGMLLVDPTDGTLVHQQRGIGHAQRLSVGNFLHDRPGNEAWISTDWGNPGIFYLFDGEGRIVTRCQPDPRCTYGFPVRWWPDGRALLMTTHQEGAALRDHHGRCVVELPDVPDCDQRNSVCDALGLGVHQLVTVHGRRVKIVGPDAAG